MLLNGYRLHSRKIDETAKAIFRILRRHSLHGVALGRIKSHFGYFGPFIKVPSDGPTSPRFIAQAVSGSVAITRIGSAHFEHTFFGIGSLLLGVQLRLAGFAATAALALLPERKIAAVAMWTRAIQPVTCLPR